MVIQKRLEERVLAIFSICILLAIVLYFFPVKTNTLFQRFYVPTPTPTPQPPFGTYHIAAIPKKDYYTIAMVGDSMTEALGIHGGKLSELLNTMYESTPGHQRIIINNYAMGSTNILGLQDVIHQNVFSSGKVDMLLIESFGYNPLSQFGLQGGLTKQSQILEQLMKTLIKSYPQTAVVFVATIAPNKETYALEEKTGDLAGRIAGAEERMAYIKNHMDFAKTHGIPLIDIYDDSLTQDGDGNILYVSPTDHIHPSFAGLDFIDQHIADFLYQSKILPQ